MKYALQFLCTTAILMVLGCQNQECDYIQEVSTSSKDYIETSDSTDFQGQKTLVFEEDNIQMKFNHSFCKTAAHGAWSCRSEVQITNLTDRNVRVYVYRSQGSRDSKQGVMAVVDCPANGVSKRFNLLFIAAQTCIDLDNLFPLIRVSYR